MKWTKILPLMLCFTLVLCTVGKAVPSVEISPPAPKIEKFIIESPACFSLQAMQHQNVTLECQVVTYDHAAIIPENEINIAEMVEVEVGYKEAMRERLPKVSFKITDPPSINKLE